jgi:hypothetical protein
MKYTRLTKEQFEELTQEFSTFWQLKPLIKLNGIPQKLKTGSCRQELDVFLTVWEGVH